MKRRTLIGGAAGFWLSGIVLAGCSVGPDFQKPEAAMPEQYICSASAANPEQAEKEPDEWWTVFHDPVLSSLVKKAIEGNLDLKLAEARILETRAARGVARSAAGPVVQLSGSFSRSQAEVSSATGIEPGTASEERTRTSNSYYAGFDALWELDVSGGKRRGIEAAGADIEASLASRHDVEVRLVAEVIRNYIELRTYQQRIAVAKQTVQAQQGMAALSRKRFLAGFESRLDVAGADANVAETAAGIPLLESSEQQAIYAIGVLTGSSPGAYIRELSPISDIPLASHSLSAGIPSELLRRRPDIRKAEAEVHAATARIGVAVADLYPKFTISASGGSGSEVLSSLFSPTAMLWSLGSSISTTLFSSGKVHARIEQQKALKEQAVVRYRQTVLSALQEVEAALVSLHKEEERRKALEQEVGSRRIALRLAEELYQQGFTSYSSVLEAKRACHESEDALLQSTGNLSIKTVALYKALGGSSPPAGDPA